MSELTLDEAIKYCLEVASENDSQAEEYNEHDEWEFANKCNCEQCAADHRQVAEWLRELKDLREENKVLTSECDRLIKEKGELLSKVSGGDVLRICQLEEQLKEAKRLLRAAVETFDRLKDTVIPFHSIMCDYAMQFANPYDACNSCPLGNVRYKTCKWEFTDEAMELIGR